MSLKISYLTPSNKNQTLLGKIVFYNTYREPSISFPYFYLGKKAEIVYYQNWPNLVPYLYDKKLGFFTTVNNIYQFKDNFKASSFSTNTGILTLNFTDENSLIVLKALYEDRELYSFENNGSYENWNKTITPINDVNLNNRIFLKTNQNYNIQNLEIINNNLINIKIKISSLENISLQNLNNKNFEFGLYRIENKSKNESIYYGGVNSKYFSTPDSSIFIGGLRTRSQIIGHSHEHSHEMPHTHTMSHTHGMSNHTHGMTHNHTYLDFLSNTYPVPYGPVLIPGGYGAQEFGINTNVVSTQVSTNRTSNNSRISTDPAQGQTGQADIFTTSLPINLSTDNNTSFNQTKTTNKDDIYTNDNNFKVSDKNYYDTHVIYTYIYGSTFVAV